MFPWWGDTVTVYHGIAEKDENGRTAVTWQNEHCENCYYSVKQQQQLNGNIMENRTVRFVRIPKMQMPLNKGDIVIHGVVYDKLADGASGKSLLENHKDSFIVNIAKDNSGNGIPIPHIYGSE